LSVGLNARLTPKSIYDLASSQPAGDIVRHRLGRRVMGADDLPNRSRHRLQFELRP